LKASGKIKGGSGEDNVTLLGSPYGNCCGKGPNQKSWWPKESNCGKSWEKSVDMKYDSFLGPFFKK